MVVSRTIRYSLAALTAAVTLAYTAPAQSFSLRDPYTIGLLAAAGHMFILYARRPVPKFKPNYELNKLARIDQIMSKEYWTNAGYAYYNGFIGQTGSSDKIKVDEDGNAKSDGKSCLPYGILGNVDAHVKPFQKAFKSLAFFMLVYGALDGDSNGFIKACKG